MQNSPEYSSRYEYTACMKRDASDLSPVANIKLQKS